MIPLAFQYYLCYIFFLVEIIHKKLYQEFTMKKHPYMDFKKYRIGIYRIQFKQQKK